MSEMARLFIIYIKSIYLLLYQTILRLISKVMHKVELLVVVEASKAKVTSVVIQISRKHQVIVFNDSLFQFSLMRVRNEIYNGLEYWKC